MTTTVLQVGTGTDDAHVLDDDTGYTDANVVVAVQDGAAGASFFAGLRFTSLDIPPGATITAATLDVYSSGYGTGFDDVEANIHLDDVDDAATFSSGDSPVARTPTTASTLWSQANLGTGWLTSPDFAAAVQEVIDRGGWASGNAVAVILVPPITSTGRILLFYAYDWVAANAAKLSVTFTPPPLFVDTYRRRRIA